MSWSEGSTRGEGPGSVEVRAEADRSRIVLRGEVDASMNAQVAGAFMEVAQRGLPADIDTRGTTFVDSTLIAAIAHLARKLPAGVTVVDPTDQVRFLLQISEVEQLVTILDAKIAVAEDVPDHAADLVDDLTSRAVAELPEVRELPEVLESRGAPSPDVTPVPPVPTAPA